ncbi:MAG: diacylglycerol kinase family protein [Propionicimonas sp.]
MSTTIQQDRTQREHSPEDGPEASAGTLRLAVVVNPSKFTDLDELRDQVEDACGTHGRVDVRWYETSPEDPGAGQAEQAVSDGANMVCSLGGDGTVRSVASALVGTEIPLGLLPGGTGNLLARNLGLPVDDLPAALAAVLTGTTRRIDVGAVSWDDEAEQIFVVMAGMGMDATMMGEADERLKDAVGWPAYLLSGARALFNPGFVMAVSAHRIRNYSRRARMVVVGNCGELTAGVKLLPNARLDDGRLDLVLVAPRGLLGWLALLRDFLTSRGGNHRAARRMTADRFELAANRPVDAELDGDAVGPRRHMRTRTLAGALLVRVPLRGDGSEES